MAKSLKLTNDNYWDSTGIVYNNTRLDKKIEATDTGVVNAQNTASSALSIANTANDAKIVQKYVSGDTIKTTTIARASFTGSYQSAYLICVPISCASSSAEDTGLVIFKARSAASATSISYGIEKTNTAQAEITQSGSTLNFNLKQTAQWRYLNCVIIAKSSNVTILI